MNSAPHLRLEDRPEFERILDEALRTMARTETDQSSPLSSAELRVLAVADATSIASHAATEYEEYVRVRERLRHPAPATTSPGTAETGGAQPGLAHSMAGNAGAGVFAVLSVLLPVLAGSAAFIFLLVGYALGLVSPEPALAPPMRNVGWVFAAVTIASALIGAVSLLLTASRNAPTASREATSGPKGTADEVAVARAAWRHALVQRGLLPYLRAAQDQAAEAGGPRPPGPRAPGDDSRTPRLGYSGPDFSAPATENGDGSVERNRYSSPAYGSSRFSSPAYSTDGGTTDGAAGVNGSERRYSSPDFSAPTTEGRNSGDADGRRFSSPAYRSGSTDGSAEGRGFSSPAFKSGSTDSPAEDAGGHRFSSPRFKSGATGRDASGDASAPSRPSPPEAAEPAASGEDPAEGAPRDP